MINLAMKGQLDRVLEGFDFGGFGGFDDIFDMFFGGGFGGRSTSRRRGPVRGADKRYDLTISFEEAAFGTKKKLKLQEMRIVMNVAVPERARGEPNQKPVQNVMVLGKFLILKILPLAAL